MLSLISTPIGNLDDISVRAIETFNKSDIILCEDTRHSIKLLNHYKIKKKLISYHKFNEKKELTKIIEYLKQGKILSLISDAGTPALSDPGNLLIKECIKQVADKLHHTPEVCKKNYIYTELIEFYKKDKTKFNKFFESNIHKRFTEFLKNHY